MTSSLERRLEILELSRKHNFLILEGRPSMTATSVARHLRDRLPRTDDPYYYLYFGTEPRPPSYFTLERDQPEIGRVIRLDSLSKVLSAGMRIGFLSAPKPIYDAVVMHVSPFALYAPPPLRPWGR